MKILTLCTLFLATPAMADEFVFFRSPTGNIGCMAVVGEYNEVRCDLRELTPSYSRRPADCDLDWGDSFAVGSSNRPGYVVCHGDTVFDPGAAVLRYGRSASFGPFTCTSAETGMTCTNGHGHGFRVARAQQSVF
jgi:hypothetical protein